MGAVDYPTDLDLRDRSSSARGLQDRLERLADAHPSSPRHPDRWWSDGDGGTDRVRPLTDAEHAEHITEVRDRLADAHGAGLQTHLSYSVDGGDTWTDERDALHDALVEYLYARSSHVPCEVKAIVTGGLPGAGKTTVLKNFAHLDLSQYMMINPDVIKEEMAERGLIPAVAGLSPMEASDLVHEEASHVAKRLANRAESDRRNVIWDITMSKPSSITDRITELRAADYSRVEGVFVDIPAAVSARRAEARHRDGHDEYRAGRGFGARYISEARIMNDSDSVWSSGNRKNFEELKSRFDGWSTYDNSVDGDAPHLVESHAAQLIGKERR